jgi:photosystem II stability/assembly factor-like uncharacterized protein
MIPTRSIAALLAALCLSTPAPAQNRDTDDLLTRIDELSAALAELREELSPSATATDPAARLAWHERHLRMSERTPFDFLSWHHIGPTNLSGRVTDVAVVTPRGETYTIYVATASGGVWKTVNDGVTWEPIFEEEATQSIGDLALAPSDQNQLWVGTGEANIFRSSMAGCGIYRSLDGGETFEYRGLGATHTIARIVVHPTDPDTVWVAASGNEWTDNEERGVFRTTDGGENWEKVLFIDEGTGAIDLVIDPEDPGTLYAATWERRRKRWNDPRCEEDHTGSGVWRSTDGGTSWEPICEGLPEPQYRGRIGIDVAQSKPGVIYAFIDNYEKQPRDEDEEEFDSYGREIEGRIKASELYRSDDRGTSWRKVSESDSYMARIPSTYGWVFGQMRVDPNDENTIYLMGLALNVSNDGGKTFRRLGGMHGDHHALWIDPANSDFLVNGNDGGVVISYDGGEKWRRFLDNLPVVQFYNVGYDMAEPFNVYGSIQDHGSCKGEVSTSRVRYRKSGGSDRGRRWRSRGAAVEWDNTSGGEASYHAIDPSNPATLYSSGFYGSIRRTDQESGERASLNLETGDEDEELRGQWLAPFIISPHNPRIIYHGMNRLFRSMDSGENFTPISPDLTRNDPDELGDIPYQTITTISESPFEFGRIFVGSDDGQLHVTCDGGKSWTLITDGLLDERWISRVIASRWTDGVVYVAQNGKRWDDLGAYLWKSEDDGATWRSIAHGIPGAPINVVKEDPKNADVLYAGTDLGVYVSLDAGESWNVLGSELPITYVHDLIVHPREDIVVIATHGRGMWALDAQPIQDAEQREEILEERKDAEKKKEKREKKEKKEKKEEKNMEELVTTTKVLSDNGAEEIEEGEGIEEEVEVESEDEETESEVAEDDEGAKKQEKKSEEESADGE